MPICDVDCEESFHDIGFCETLKVRECPKCKKQYNSKS